MSTRTNKHSSSAIPENGLYLPFALPLIQGKKLKKNCCKKYKKSKRCKRCPNG